MRIHICAVILAAGVAAQAAQAQPFEVTVPIGQGSLTGPSTSAATEEIKNIPGGANVVPSEEFEKSYAVSMKDMLAQTPGVMAQPRWGEESRLSIRGSGLSRSFHLRGITLLQDGIPFTFADGSGDFQEIDPLTLQHVEVYRGGNGLRYGAATLGGAINMVTPTGRTAGHNVLLRAEAGSYGTLRTHAQVAHSFNGADVFAAATKSLSDGYRQQSESDNERFSGNVGLRLSDNAETRFYLAWNNLKQEVPGTLSKDDALNHPKRVQAINLLDDYARDIRSLRIANRTVIRLNNGLRLEAGAYVNDKTLYHPIFQVIDQESLDLGGFGRIKGSYGPNDFVLGLNVGRGVNNADRFENEAGKRGVRRADGKQIARNIEMYGENAYELVQDWKLVTGLQATLSKRSYQDYLNNTNNDEKTYNALNPKLGLMWYITPGSSVFANISRSSEAPTFSELVQFPVTGFVPLDPQTAWMAEIGTRGVEGAFSWDATLYHSRIKNELLQFSVGPDIPASTFNAEDTIHQGLELGAGWQATDSISFSAVYNFNDFRFDGDDQFDDNDLAGAPPHQIRLAARFEKDNVFVEPNLEYVPEAGWVDYANTLKADSYAVVGVKAGWDVAENISLFLDARNLTDEEHITSFSTMTDARVGNTAVFYPGEGRSVFGGIQIKF